MYYCFSTKIRQGLTLIFAPKLGMPYFFMNNQCKVPMLPPYIQYHTLIHANVFSLYKQGELHAVNCYDVGILRL